MSLAAPVTVVIVDDEPGHVELIRRNLRRAGISNPILAVGRGQDALDCVFARLGQSLLLLLDIRMPGPVDGIEVLRRLKHDARTRAIPVIMLTTSDDPREIDTCYDLGCNVFVTKPVDPVAFIEAIQRFGLFLSVVAMPRPHEAAT